MLKIGKIALFMVLVSPVVFANDTFIKVAGASVERMDEGSTNVVMKSAEINITLLQDHYDVHVKYTFYNSGDDETLTVGFPVKMSFKGYGLFEVLSYVQNFKTVINGEKIPDNEIKIIDKISVDEDNKFAAERITRWYTRDIVFKGKDITHSEVSYRGRYEGMGTVWPFELSYIYGTAANWKGNVDSLKFIINHTDDELISAIYIDSVSQKQFNMNTNFTWLGNGKYMFEMVNVNLAGYEEIYIHVTIFENGFSGVYDGEFAMDEGFWPWNKEKLEPDSGTGLYFLTKNQIRLLINFFYALHGYEFKDKNLKAYFEKAGIIGPKIQNPPLEDYISTTYTINPNFKESDFNEIERANIDYLRKLEKMVP